MSTHKLPQLQAIPEDVEPQTPVQAARRIYQEHPFACIGAAVGLGYVIGGGLRTPMTGRLLKLGAQKFLLPTLTATAMQQLGLGHDES